jgi:lysophospholipase L1-like esterase
MKKYIVFMLFVTILLLMGSCTLKDPSQPAMDTPTYQPLFSRMAAVGNSLTMGIQSAGIKEAFQKHSYPYYIAMQTGNASTFQMPLVAEPGIGGDGTQTPMYLDDNGNIVQDNLTVNPLTLLKNVYLDRPYDNLGIAGFDLNDALNTTTGTMASLVLRNPNLGNTSQIQQAIMLNPTVILLWLGNNDVLGAALDGGDLTQITDPATFQANLTTVVTKLGTETNVKLMVMANIPNVTDIPYVNILDHVVMTTNWGTGPVLFDANLMPINFGSEAQPLYLPILTADSSVVHVTLVGLQAYKAGIGVPDQTALVGMGLSEGQASQIIAALTGAGMTPSGTPMPGTMTITSAEATAIATAVTTFNAIIAGISARGNTNPADDIPLVDINAILNDLNDADGYDGYSGKYVLADPANTAFSLDGVHPNNGGQALIANAFIAKINQVMTLQGLPTIPELNTADYKGQYLPGGSMKINKTDFGSVKRLLQ